MTDDPKRVPVVEPHLITFAIRLVWQRRHKFTVNGIDLHNLLVSKRSVQNQHGGAG
jgi:hypothetical protein